MAHCEWGFPIRAGSTGWTLDGRQAACVKSIGCLAKAAPQPPEAGRHNSCERAMRSGTRASNDSSPTILGAHVSERNRDAAALGVGAAPASAHGLAIRLGTQMFASLMHGTVALT